MKLERVKNLSAEGRFFYWMKERHRIHERREAGKPKPWTDDEVLQNYFFTNPYRENDKVTRWFRRKVRWPLRNNPKVLMATVIFRWFNLPQIGETLMSIGKGKYGALTRWNKWDVLKRLKGERSAGNRIFTGAFMINSPPGVRKLEAICDRIDMVWEDRLELLHRMEGMIRLNQVKLEGAHQELIQYEGLGGFMAYEVVCDLRYTYLLREATDVDIWCNPGPGCIRGLYRLAGEEFDASNNSTSPPRPKDWQERMTKLLKKAHNKFGRTDMPRIEMREIEHSLCEFDKYERARLNEGKLKRKYNGHSN